MDMIGEKNKRNITELELLELLAEAENDVVHGRVSPIQYSFDDLRAALGKGDNINKLQRADPSTRSFYKGK